MTPQIKHISLFFLLLCSSLCFAQTDSSKSSIQFSGYLEAYYAYDLGNPQNHNKPDFIYSHNRHNEVSLNVGYIKAAYMHDKARANFALMAGTYANVNLASEPGVLKNVLEANIGVRLSKQKNLWIDGGVFESHIGFESETGKNCWNLTRSILADNSPYYESGVKLGYTSDNQKWFLSLLYLNGWQTIQRPDGFNRPAFGHQITYTPNSNITLNSSSFVGSDTPDSTQQTRYFHNLYGIFQAHKRLGITAGFDIGAQQKIMNATTYDVW
jgi:Putative beta-barrel porin-2, OmpL-like. bbp2